MLDSTVSLGAGATMLGFAIAAHNHQDAADATISLVIGIISASTLAVGGLISLFSTSEAERRWDAYQALRAQLAAERAAERERLRGTPPQVTATITPVLTPQLVGGVLQARF
jgi:hypothetical protein